MINQPISVLDALAYLAAIEHRAIAMGEALDHFARTAPEPYRSYFTTWAGTAENIADQAHAAEAALNP